MAQTEVLRPFDRPERGVFPNPGGRPRNQFSPTALLRELAAERPQFVEKLVDKANAGDYKSTELVMAYLDGKPVQRTLDVSVTAAWSDLMAAQQQALAAMLLGSTAAMPLQGSTLPATDAAPIHPSDPPTLQ